MPWRLLLFLLALAVVAVLFAANVEHRSPFSFIFGRLEEVPVFMALLLAFVAGALTMLPFTIGPHRRRREKRQKPADAALPRPAHAQPAARIGAPYEPAPDAERGGRKRGTRGRRRVGRA